MRVNAFVCSGYCICYKKQPITKFTLCQFNHWITHMDSISYNASIGLLFKDGGNKTRLAMVDGRHGVVQMGRCLNFAKKTTSFLVSCIAVPAGDHDVVLIQ